MPLNGCSTEFVGRCEDDIAVMLTARDHIERLRVLGKVLERRGMITQSYLRDYLDSLDYIAAAMLRGKHNTARLRGCNHE